MTRAWLRHDRRTRIVDEGSTFPEFLDHNCGTSSVILVTVAFRPDVYDSPMKSEPAQNLRVVIQFIRGDVPKYSRYRLIAYGEQNFRPAESLSFLELAQRFEAAGIPQEQRPIASQYDLNQTKIIFSADLSLTRTQLQILGLGL